MSYTDNFTLTFGQAGVGLSAMLRFYDSSGIPVGDDVTGFVEVGATGSYLKSDVIVPTGAVAFLGVCAGVATELVSLVHTATAEAVAAIAAPIVTVNPTPVTVNPTVLSTGERAAIAAATDSVITANHGTGTYGSATLAAGVVITPVTLGTDGTALGRVMPYGRVTVYHGDEAQYVFNADADGDYSYELPVGSVWTLVARRSGYQDTEATVSTEDAVS